MSKEKTCTYSVDGLHCDSCELFVEQAAKKLKGVKKVDANSKTHKMQVVFTDEVSEAEFQNELNTVLKNTAYQISEEHEQRIVHSKHHAAPLTYVLAFVIASLIGYGFLYFERFNIASFFTATHLTPTNAAFLGFIASLTPCMGVVAGVVISISSTFKNQQHGVISFHAGRILGFMLLGGVTGMLGRMVIINGVAVTVVKIMVALLMVGIALDMLGIKLPKLALPKAVSKTLNTFNDKEGITGAFLAGVLTYFLPCAFTQSVQLYSLSTRSFIDGAITMGAFAVGTLPILLVLSYATAVVNVKSFRQSIPHYVMAFILLFLAIYNALAAVGIVS